MNQPDIFIGETISEGRVMRVPIRNPQFLVRDSWNSSLRNLVRNIEMCFDNTLGAANERKHSKTI